MKAAFVNGMRWLCNLLKSLHWFAGYLSVLSGVLSPYIIHQILIRDIVDSAILSTVVVVATAIITSCQIVSWTSQDVIVLSDTSVGFWAAQYQAVFQDHSKLPNPERNVLRIARLIFIGGVLALVFQLVALTAGLESFGWSFWLAAPWSIGLQLLQLHTCTMMRTMLRTVRTVGGNPISAMLNTLRTSSHNINQVVPDAVLVSHQVGIWLDRADGLIAGRQDEETGLVMNVTDMTDKLKKQLQRNNMARKWSAHEVATFASNSIQLGIKEYKDGHKAQAVAAFLGAQDVLAMQGGDDSEIAAATRIVCRLRAQMKRK